MKKKSKYGRNPKLNPKTHCVMVRFDDEEWNRFLTMYEESEVYAKAVFSQGTLLWEKVQGTESGQDNGGLHDQAVGLSRTVPWYWHEL